MVTNPSGRPAWEDAGVRCRQPSHCWWRVGTQLLRWLERPRGLARADAIRRQLRQCHIAFRRMEKWVNVFQILLAQLWPWSLLYIFRWLTRSTLNVTWSFSLQVYRLKKWGVSFRSQEGIQREETRSQCRSELSLVLMKYWITTIQFRPSTIGTILVFCKHPTALGICINYRPLVSVSV